MGCGHNGSLGLHSNRMVRMMHLYSKIALSLWMHVRSHGFSAERHLSET